RLLLSTALPNSPLRFIATQLQNPSLHQVYEIFPTTVNEEPPRAFLSSQAADSGIQDVETAAVAPAPLATAQPNCRGTRRPPAGTAWAATTTEERVRADRPAPSGDSDPQLLSELQILS